MATCRYPAIMIDGAIAEHFEVLGVALLFGVRIVKAVHQTFREHRNFPPASRKLFHRNGNQVKNGEGSMRLPAISLEQLASLPAVYRAVILPACEDRNGQMRLAAACFIPGTDSAERSRVLLADDHPPLLDGVEATRLLIAASSRPRALR